MPRPYSKRLVIDASVLRAAGSVNAVDARSRNCRDLLQAVVRICHRAVLTPELREEWNKHQSRFALTWRRDMVQRRKTVEIMVEPDDDLRTRIEAAPLEALRGSRLDEVAVRQRRAAMLKDCRLIEAALQADRIIISRDDAVRALFATASETVTDLRRVVWVNPDHAEEECLEWLAGGARPEPSRTLASYRARLEQ